MTMACKSCQERREAIAKMAKEIGTIVFGGRRKLANFAEREGKKPTARREVPTNGVTRT